MSPSRNSHVGHRGHLLAPPRSKRPVELIGGMLVCLLVLGAASSFAQSLGEAARQERARKQSQPHPATRVYTKDDLARPQILAPEDRARIEAARKEKTPPSAEPAVDTSSSGAKPAEVPLGDVARAYRLLKQLHQKQEVVETPSVVGTTPLASPTFSRPLTARPATFASDLRKPASAGVTKPDTGDKPRAVTVVQVRPGDSLWKLAERHLGRGSRWHRLAALNPEVADPHQLQIGQWIRLTLIESVPAHAKQRRVKKGDSLWRLAQAEFGSGQAWGCIARTNPQLQNPNLIYAAQILSIPTDCPQAP